MKIAEITSNRYPVCLYYNNIKLPRISNELHINITENNRINDVTCHRISCTHCLIYTNKGCMAYSNGLIDIVFPEISLTHPELFI